MRTQVTLALYIRALLFDILGGGGGGCEQNIQRKCQQVYLQSYRRDTCVGIDIFVFVLIGTGMFFFFIFLCRRDFFFFVQLCRGRNIFPKNIFALYLTVFFVCFADMFLI